MIYEILTVAFTGGTFVLISVGVVVGCRAYGSLVSDVIALKAEIAAVRKFVEAA